MDNEKLAWVYLSNGEMDRLKGERARKIKFNLLSAGDNKRIVAYDENCYYNLDHIIKIEFNF